MKLFCRHKDKEQLVKYYMVQRTNLYTFGELILYPVFNVTVYSVKKCSNCNKIFESEILKKEVEEKNLSGYLYYIKLSHGVISKEEYILK